jgi:hypothetical protein
MGRPKKEPPKAFHFIELQAYFRAICNSEENMANKHTAVMVKGKQYKSLAAAFMALGLPMARHQLFRKKLKEEKSAEFEGIVFTVVE